MKFQGSTIVFKAFIALTAFIFPASQINAHTWKDSKPDNSSPFDECCGWRFVGQNQRRDSATFIGYIERVSNSVSFETVTVFKSKIKNQYNFEYDQHHFHIIGDCTTQEIKFTLESFFSFGSPPLPPAIETVPTGTNMYQLRIVKVKEGTLLHKALSIACDYDYTESREGRIEPWNYSRQLFQN